MTAEDFMNGLLCNSRSSSQGRQMCSHLSAPHINIISMAVPVGNNALQSVGVAEAVQHRSGSPLVLCAVGDGAAQEGKFLEAVSEAVRRRLPIIFLIEDNQWAISTRTTGQTFYSLPSGRGDQFMGTDVQRLDGRDPIAAYEGFGEIVQRLRQHREPVLVVLEVERLTSHTNADDQRLYRDEKDIRRAANCGDPVVHMKSYLLENGCDVRVLASLEEEIQAEVASAEIESLQDGDPQPEFTAKIPLPIELTHPQNERRGLDGDS